MTAATARIATASRSQMCACAASFQAGATSGKGRVAESGVSRAELIGQTCRGSPPRPAFKLSRQIPSGRVRHPALGGFVHLYDVFPIDQMVHESLEIIGAPIPVVNVV